VRGRLASARAVQLVTARRGHHLAADANERLARKPSRRLERGLGVAAASVPEHPLVDVGIVGGLNLGSHLRRPVRGRSQSEILEPGTRRPGPLHGGRPRNRPLQRGAHDLVRAGVRLGVPEAHPRVVARVDHGKSDIDDIDERLPVLPDTHIGTRRGGDAEDVGRDHGAGPPKLIAAVGEEFPHHVPARAPVVRRKPGVRHLPRGRVRKAHVVPLDFREASGDGLAGKRDMISPDLRVVGIQPDGAPRPDPDSARRVPHRQLRSRRSEYGVLGDHDAGDGHDAGLFELAEQPVEVGNAGPGCAGADRQGHRRGVADDPGGVLDVYDEGVDLGSLGERQQLGHATARASGPGVDVDAPDVLRSLETVLSRRLARPLRALFRCLRALNGMAPGATGAAADALGRAPVARPLEPHPERQDEQPSY